MLSTGDHGELINCGWLAMSDPNAPVATNAVPLTSNRTGCGWVGSRHVSHAPTAYMGMTMRIHTRSENDRPSRGHCLGEQLIYQAEPAHGRQRIQPKPGHGHTSMIRRMLLR